MLKDFFRCHETATWFLMAALSGKEPPKPIKAPVRRRIDFDNVFDIETEVQEDSIQCGQETLLTSLEVALMPGYLHDGWMTSRFGWLVLGLTALSDSISVYTKPSPKEWEKEERKDR